MTKCVKSSVRDESGKVSKLHHFTVMQPLKPGKDRIYVITPCNGVQTKVCRQQSSVCQDILIKCCFFSLYQSGGPTDRQCWLVQILHSYVVDILQLMI